MSDASIHLQDAHELKNIDPVSHIEDDRRLGDEQIVEAVSAYADMSKLSIARRFWKVPLYGGFAAFAAIFDGYAVTIPGNIVANPGFVAVFGTIQTSAGLVLDPRYVGAWTGVQSAGQIIGMWGGPFASDRFGRKWIMWLTTVWLLLAIILELVAKNCQVFLAARLFAGIGTGFVQSGITVYISEIAPAQIRGSLLSMYSLFFGLGQFAGAIALKIVAGLPPSDFRHAFYSEFVFVGLYILMVLIIPESPWYYARRHKDDQAKKSMLRLYGTVDNYDVNHEFEVLRQNVAAYEALHRVQKKASFLEIFKGVNGRRTFVSFFPLVFQQFLGSSLIFGYSTYFFSLSGLTDPFLASLIINLLLLTFITLSFFTVETVGRRPSLLVGGSIMGLCTLFIGVLASIQGPLNGTALVSLCAIWVTAYALSAGPLGECAASEQGVSSDALCRLHLPCRIVNPTTPCKDCRFAAGGTCFVGLIFNYCVPIMLANPGANWGPKIGFFWAGLTSIALAIVYFTIPETKSRTYEELDELFTRKISARRFRQTKTAVDVAKETHQVA